VISKRESSEDRTIQRLLQQQARLDQTACRLFIVEHIGSCTVPLKKSAQLEATTHMV
jgi:hypothetical protein